MVSVLQCWHHSSPLLVTICHLFISSISTGRILLQCSIHYIIPIHKSNDKTLSGMIYCPISLLSIMSKLWKDLFTIVWWTFKRTLSHNIDSASCQWDNLQQLILFTEKMLDSKLSYNTKLTSYNIIIWISRKHLKA